MKDRLITSTGRKVLWMLAALLLAAAPLAPAQTPKKPEIPEVAQAPSFDTFQNVIRRNIFSRQGLQPDRPFREDYRTSQTEHLNLIGAWVDGPKAYAYFDGSRPDWTTVVEQGGTIAGLTVAAIVPQGVRLECDGQQQDLQTGWGLNRVGDSPWEVVRVEVGSGPTLSGSPVGQVSAAMLAARNLQNNPNASMSALMNMFGGGRGGRGGRNGNNRNFNGGGGPGGGGGRFNRNGGGGGFGPNGGGTDTAAATPTPAPTATPTSAQAAETARLMMERRRQETGQ